MPELRGLRGRGSPGDRKDLFAPESRQIRIKSELIQDYHRRINRQHMNNRRRSMMWIAGRPSCQTIREPAIGVVFGFVFCNLI